VHQVVGVVGRGVAGAALALAEKDLLAAQLGGGSLACSGAAPVSGDFLESALASSRSGTGRSIQRKPAPADVIIADWTFTDSGNNLFAIGHSNRASAFTLLSADHLLMSALGPPGWEPSGVTS